MGSERRIWKYPVPVTDFFSLDLPRGALFLDVQLQGEEPMLWALVAPAESVERVQFAVVGTGNPFPDEGEWWHIGTFQLHKGMLVFHLFYRNSGGD